MSFQCCLCRIRLWATADADPAILDTEAKKPSKQAWDLSRLFLISWYFFGVPQLSEFPERGKTAISEMRDSALVTKPSDIYKWWSL